MQYPVPQFTDVEDKIIGPLTFRQFGILAFAGTIIFLFYSSTKNIPSSIVVLLLVGLPALALAFGKMNGRPLYTNFPSIVQFVLSPKVMIFYKEGFAVTEDTNIEASEISQKAKEAAKTAPVASPNVQLKQLEKLLSQRAKEEQELVEKQ